MVFQTSRKGIEFALYPAGLFLAAMFALLALGAYQWLSSRIVPDHTPVESGEQAKD
ncbi:MAG TPA: hypothetical protein VKZ85_12615 [Woeseiaceae bacterium]|nr:hypothetical protein [Woeseiaceae bacterium]